MIIVTGSASGLGFAVASALNRGGKKVLGVDIASHGLQSWPAYVADVSKESDVESIASRLHRPCEAIVNCAGVSHIDYLEDMKVEDWDRVMAINVRSLMLIGKHFLPVLKEAQGTIINIVSNASHLPMTASSAYNASKGAAHILTQQMARELSRRHGITVMGVSPARLAGTSMSSEVDARVSEVRGWDAAEVQTRQQEALLAGEIPPQVVADFIAFLLSDPERSRYLTGCVIPYGA